jgi:hypothetical protein
MYRHVRSYRYQRRQCIISMDGPVFGSIREPEGTNIAIFAWCLAVTCVNSQHRNDAGRLSVAHTHTVPWTVYTPHMLLSSASEAVLVVLGVPEPPCDAAAEANGKIEGQGVPFRASDRR